MGMDEVSEGRVGPSMSAKWGIQVSESQSISFVASDRSDPRPSRPGRARRSFVALISILAILLLVPALAGAESRRSGGGSSSKKLARGAANMTLGVLALPGQILQTTREKGPFVGATWGFVKGVGFTVASEVIGVYEFLTCPFEWPPNFQPILTPEYPWDYFTGDR